MYVALISAENLAEVLCFYALASSAWRCVMNDQAYTVYTNEIYCLHKSINSFYKYAKYAQCYSVVSTHWLSYLELCFILLSCNFYYIQVWSAVATQPILLGL